MELLSILKAILLFLSSFTKPTTIPANESSGKNRNATKYLLPHLKHIRSFAVETSIPHAISDEKNHSNELPMEMAALMAPTPAVDYNQHHSTTQYNSSSTADIDTDTDDKRQTREEITKFPDKSLPETASLDATISNLHR